MTERQFEILKTLVKINSDTNKSVSSKMLSDQFNLSASMLRYELQALEKAGYIEKETHSSGRIPTDKAFKYIISQSKFSNENLKENDALNELKIQLNDLFDSRNQEIDEVLKSAFDLLNKFTKTITITDKKISNATIIDIKHYRLEDGRLNLIVMMSDGEIFNQIFSSDDFGTNDVDMSINIITKQLLGKTLHELQDTLTEAYSSTHAKIKNNEDYFLTTVKKLLNKIEANINQSKITQNSLINFLEVNQNIVLLKELIKQIENQNIWDLFNLNIIDYDEKTRISLNSRDTNFSNNSLIERRFQFGSGERKIYLLGNKSQNYDELIDLLNFIETKIIEI